MLVGITPSTTKYFSFGAYSHKTDTVKSYEQRGLTEAGAASYSPAAVEDPPGTIVNIQKRKVDDSGQWFVTWEEVIEGTWEAGEGP